MSIFKEIKDFKKEVVGNHIMFNSDALSVLSQIKDKSIDFVCIDPPYDLDNHGGGKTELAQRDLVKDLHINFISDGFDIESVFSEIERVSKVLNLICFCSNKQVSKIMNYWEQKKYSTTLLVWDKPNPIPLGNGKHISNLEFMVFVRGKGATFNNIGVNEQKKTFSYSAPSSKTRFHPTQKPVELINRLLRLHTNENDIVLDCFAGSMTTADACQELNRKSVMVELDEKFFESGVDRIRNKQ